MRKRMKLGEAARQAVRDFEGTQRGLCRLAGISESALSHFVAGRKQFSVTRLDRLADVLQLKLRARPRGAAIASLDRLAGVLEPEPRRRPGRATKASAADARKLSRKTRPKRGRKRMAR